MSNKLDYTRQIIKRLPDQSIAEDDAVAIWWQDTRDNNSLRLSYYGYQRFKQAGIDSYEFELPIGTSTRASALLALSRKVTSPYYITISKKPAIVFFDGKEATVYSLYGDFDKYLKFLNRQ